MLQYVVGDRFSNDRKELMFHDTEELEEEAKHFQAHKSGWSDQDLAIMEKYYKRVARQKTCKVSGSK